MPEYPGDDETLSIADAVFRAKITGSALVGSVYRHAFTEQVLDQAGEYITPESPRTGTTTRGWLALVSGAQIPNDSLVWAAFAGTVDGVSVYDAIGAAAEGVTAVKKGKLDATMAYLGSAVMSVWAYGTAEADTGENVTVYDWLLVSGQSISSGTQVVAGLIAGRWYVIGAQCGGEAGGGMTGEI